MPYLKKIAQEDDPEKLHDTEQSEDEAQINKSSVFEMNQIYFWRVLSQIIHPLNQNEQKHYMNKENIINMKGFFLFYLCKSFVERSPSQNSCGVNVSLNSVLVGANKTRLAVYVFFFFRYRINPGCFFLREYN